MTHKPTCVINQFAESRAKLIEKVKSFFNLPEYGVLLYFDDQDYPRLTGDLWKESAFHQNVQLGVDSISQYSPRKIKELVKSCQYSNLIWLSARVCRREDIAFAWTLAHELRHLKQDLYSHNLAVDNDLIYYFAVVGIKLGEQKECIKIDEPVDYLTIPAEKDAQLEAWRLTRKLFLENKTDLYVESKKKDDALAFKRLSEKDREKEYDVVAHTKAFLENYSQELRKLQEKIPDNCGKPFSTFRVIDIGKECATLAQLQNQKGLLKSDILNS